MTELRFEAVTVHYGRGRHGYTAVDAADLPVPSGQVVGLVGESGCGKSSLARAAVGLVPTAAGRVLLDGVPLAPKPSDPRRRALQMVFQDPYSSLNPRMTIGESIAEPIPRDALPAAGSRAAARRAEVARLLELVQLDPERARQYPAQLSGGQRQRVALARALAGRPSVIIADEITSALDVSVQGTVLNLLRDLQSQLHLSVLFISHNLAVVRYVSDIIAVMHRSRIVEYGPADAVLTDPGHPHTRALLAAAPRPDTRVADGADPAEAGIPASPDSTPHERSTS